jgi:hypothetical protein
MICPLKNAILLAHEIKNSQNVDFEYEGLVFSLNSFVSFDAPMFFLSIKPKSYGTLSCRKKEIQENVIFPYTIWQNL